MDKLAIINEEYKIVYDNYKITFNNSLELIKFYTSLVTLVSGAIVIKITTTTNQTQIYVFKNWIILIISILILLGIFCFFSQQRLLAKRKKSILQMNFLREKLLTQVDSKFYKDYVNLAGFSKTIERQNVAFSGNYIIPQLYILAIITFLSIGLWWIISKF